MSERKHAHQLIDCLTETQLSALVVFLEAIVEPEEANLNNAPLDDEPETEIERVAVEEARASLKKSGGKGIPHADAMRQLGLE